MVNLLLVALKGAGKTITEKATFFFLTYMCLYSNKLIHIRSQGLSEQNKNSRYSNILFYGS